MVEMDVVGSRWPGIWYACIVWNGINYFPLLADTVYICYRKNRVYRFLDINSKVRKLS